MKCLYCNGKGFIPEYSHIEGGRCFGCQGTGRLDESKVEEAKENQQKWEEIEKAHRKAERQKACAELLFNGTMPFGKHKGKTFFDIMEEDEGYIKWMALNVEDVNIQNASVATWKIVKEGNEEIEKELKRIYLNV